MGAARAFKRDLIRNERGNKVFRRFMKRVRNMNNGYYDIVTMEKRVKIVDTEAKKCRNQLINKARVEDRKRKKV